MDMGRENAGKHSTEQKCKALLLTWEKEYFLSLFTPEQPDLNWENPDVRAAVHNVLRFWLDRGASGFRMVRSVELRLDLELLLTKVFIKGCHQSHQQGPDLSRCRDIRCKRQMSTG